MVKLMTPAEITENQKQSAQQKKYDEYKAALAKCSSDEERKELREQWLTYLTQVMDNYIKYRIRVKNRTIGAEFDDLFQRGRWAVAMHGDDFNPYRASASAYFTVYIDQFTREECIPELMSEHYVKHKIKLDKVARKHGFTGMLDERLTPDMLSVISGVSIKTVLETLKHVQYSVSSLEQTTDNFDLDFSLEGNCENSISYKTPEKAVLDQELSDLVTELLSDFSSFDRWLFENTVLSDDPISYRNLTKFLKTSEAEEMFGEELPKQCDQKSMKRRVMNCIRRVKYAPKLARYMSIQDNAYEPIIEEQASPDDIGAAILDGLFDEDGDGSPVAI